MHRWARVGFLFSATSAAALGPHPAVTLFESHLAAAGTGIFCFRFGKGVYEMRFPFCYNRHHIRGGATGAHQHAEDLKRFVDTVEESLVSGTQVVQAGLTIWGNNKAVFGAATIAYEPNLAKLTIMG